MRTATIVLLLAGGYGLTGTWFVAGVLGVPRRYAIQPPGTNTYSLVGAIFAIVFALGFAACLVQLAPLARVAWQRRHDERPPDGPLPLRSGRRGLPLASPLQLAFGAAGCVVALAAFFPEVVHASETSLRYHHLDHAGDFLFGVLLGLLLGSLPAGSRLLGERATLGAAAVIAAPTLMMLLMVPRFYEPLERTGYEHALFHVAMGAFGLLTGLGATRLGLVTGRLAALLSVAMTLMFAAAMKGG
jgi:hypothetical protein